MLVCQCVRVCVTTLPNYRRLTNNPNRDNYNEQFNTQILYSALTHSLTRGALYSLPARGQVFSGTDDGDYQTVNQTHKH